MAHLHCSSIRILPVLAMLAITAPALAARLDPALSAQLADLDATATVEVIVTFDGDGPPDGGDLALLSGLGLKGVTLRGLRIAGVVATGAQIDALLARDQVRSVWFNAPLQYESREATATGKATAGAGPQLRDPALPYSGRGVGVLVNDSGIDGRHPDLRFPDHVVQNIAAKTELQASTALAPISYTEGMADTDPADGHGTRVAGILGGAGAATGQERFNGVAPGADIIGYGCGPGPSILDALGGFDYALTRQFEYNIRVVSGSFGNAADTGTAFDPDDPISVATKALADRGVVVVFPAGNAGSGKATITGNFKKAPWVVTVAAGDNGSGVSGYSSRGADGNGGRVRIGGQTYDWADRPTVTAPEAPVLIGESGTSMAAPHVAGIVALMLEANPALSWREVKQILQDTATTIPGHADWEAGAGYANPRAAVQAALGAADFGTTVKLNGDLDARAQAPVTTRPQRGLDPGPAEPDGPDRLVAKDR